MFDVFIICHLIFNLKLKVVCAGARRDGGGEGASELVPGVPELPLLDAQGGRGPGGSGGPLVGRGSVAGATAEHWVGV